MAFKLNIGKAINKAVGNISKGFKQENNPFKKLHENLQSIEKPNFKNIGEQLNVNKPNIKEGMDMKYGTGDFATGGSKAAQRMKPGESQYQYNVRMQKANRTTANGTAAESAPTITSGQEIRGLEYVPTKQKKSEFSSDLGSRWNPVTKKFESTFDPSSFNLESGIKTNLGDLRKPAEQPESNFGITEGMSFGEAFRQVANSDAIPGETTFKWGDSEFLYDFAKENNKKTKVDKNAGPRADKVKKKEINDKTIEEDIKPTPGPLDPNIIAEELDFEDFQRITKPINESMGGVQSSYLGQPIIDPIIKQSMKLSGRGLNKLFKGQPEPEIRGSIRYRRKK